MTLFGLIFIVSTILILFFKNEKNGAYYDNINEDTSIIFTYKSLWNVLKLKPIQTVITFLLTWKVKLIIYFNFHELKNIY